MAGHVFISHGSENRDEANELCAFIESHGVTAWIAPRDVRPGIDYSEALQAAIEGCAAFVVLVTDMANKSPYVRAETEMAFSNSKPIFPVRLGDIKPAPGLAFFLKIRHWTDAYGKYRESSLDRLALELRTLSGIEPPAPPSAPAAETPAPPAEPPPIPVPPPAPAPAPPVLAKAPPAPSPAPAARAEADRAETAIGPNASWYLERWRRMDARRSQVQWNWPAGLASLFWFAYRKMWAPVAALGLFFVLLSVLGVLTMSLPVAIGAGVLALAAMAASGALGTTFYRRQVGKLIAATAGRDREAALAQLKAKGGVSPPAVIAAAVIAAVAAALIAVVVIRRVEAKRELENDSWYYETTPSDGGGSTENFTTGPTDAETQTNFVESPAIEDSTANVADVTADDIRNMAEEAVRQLEQQQTAPPAPVE